MDFEMFMLLQAFSLLVLCRNLRFKSYKTILNSLSSLEQFEIPSFVADANP